LTFTSKIGAIPVLLCFDTKIAPTLHHGTSGKHH
jgi:hypothetical protein